MNISAKISACGVALFIGLLSSCNLNHAPGDLIRFEDSFKTIEDLEKWDNGIYSTLRGKMGGAFIMPQEVQADMLNAHQAAGSYTSFYIWDTKANDGALSALYQAYYAALVDVNLVLNNSDKVELTDADKATYKDRLDRYKGDAYFARAFYYFNLAMRWGMPYVEATAATDLAVPYSTDLSPLRLLPRANNEVVWGGILSDLDNAEKLLASVPGKEGSDEITKDAPIALRARVYYYMNMPEKALAEAEKLILGGAYPLIPALKEPLTQETMPEPQDDPFVQMWQRDSGREQIWQPHIEKPNELTNTTDLYGADLVSQKYWEEKEPDAVTNYNKPGYIPTADVLHVLFADNKDRRAQAYFEYAYTTVNTSANRFGYIYVVSKFKGNPAYRDRDSRVWGGYIPNGLQAPKPFRIAEQFLIAAETAAEIGQTDKALLYINHLRQSRGLEPIKAAGNSLIRVIRDERARELAYEGFRLWDLRKWGEGFKRGDVQHDTDTKGTEFINKNVTHVIEIKPENPLFIWGFPSDEVNNINPNLVQNKGWQ